MPRIPDQLLRSVVYLFPDQASAEAGTGSGGTGFLVALEDAHFSYLYVVSNIHVVRSGGRTLRINTEDGEVETVTIAPSAWIDHADGDDVSIAPLDLEIPSDWAVTALPWKDFGPTPERMAELNVGVGDDVVMLGRFVGHSGRQRNQPLARFGNIAMMDEERVRDGRGTLVDAYLVEMRSLPGFSGSPVFLTIGPGSYRGVYGTDAEAKMMPFYEETVGLLGIDTGHKPLVHPVVDEKGEAIEPPQRVEQNSGIAIVAPYYAIADILEGPELTDQRAQQTKEWLEDPEFGVAD
jgi:hypothetical protein